MVKSELIIALAEKAKISLEEAELVVETTFGEMKQALREGRRVEIRGFGSFAMKNYESYTGRNPRTGEAVIVKPKRLPYFKVGKELHEMLNPRKKKFA